MYFHAHLDALLNPHCLPTGDQPFREDKLMPNVVITGAARTPMGGFQGAFEGLSAADQAALL